MNYKAVEHYVLWLNLLFVKGSRICEQNLIKPAILTVLKHLVRVCLKCNLRAVNLFTRSHVSLFLSFSVMSMYIAMISCVLMT